MTSDRYIDVVGQIENARRFGNLPGVEVSRRMLKQLGDPQRSLSFVHIAGTNGKGSTAAFLSSILQKAGKKVGVFTSPHLVDFEERIVIKSPDTGEFQIPKETVTALGERLLSTDFSVSPTMFDYCLVMAVLFFVEERCDVAVMETGLGGRLDSTSALGTPIVSLITKIGFDHMSILGNTLEEIAAEKAGIIRAGAPVIWERQEPEAERILAEAVKKTGTLGRCITEAELWQTGRLPRRMLGDYQLENAALAAAGAGIVLEKLGVPQEIAENALSAGIAEARWPGRMELLTEEPLFLVDGAHNGHGVHALAESLKTLYPGRKFHFLMGVMADKDYETMIEELLLLAIDFTTVTPESDRALQAEELAAAIRKKQVPASFCPDLKAALRERLSDTVAFGSLYFIGEILKIMQKRRL